MAKRRGSHTVAVDDLRATAAWCGASWGVSCWEADCKARIVGYRGERVATLAAAYHLMWHVNGKPTCEGCGAWLAYRSSKRCRKGPLRGDDLMPGLFRRREPITPAFPTVPAESSPDRDDKRIAGLNVQIWEAWLNGDKAKADRLLDMRNAVRKPRPAPVPVVPGRVDSIIDNFWENP